MRILIAVGHNGIYSGGSYQSLYALKSLQNDGHDVLAIWGPDGNNDPNGFRELTQAHIPFKIIPITNNPNRNSIQQFRKAIEHFKPDVIECVKSGAQYHGLWNAYLHKSPPMVFYRGINRKMDFFQAFKYKLNKVKRVIANCNALKRSMSDGSGINPNKIDVVYGEYEPRCANPNAIDASSLRDELKIPNDAVLFTLLGNYSEWRGQRYAIEAIDLLRDINHNCYVLFCGLGTEVLTPEINKRNLHERISVSTFRRDPERVLKASDVALNTSIDNESLSGALLNAQVLGLPAIVSDVAGNGEIVIDGETGFVIEPANAQELSKAILKFVRLSEVQKTEMRRKARQNAIERFSPETRLKKRLECYLKAL